MIVNTNAFFCAINYAVSEPLHRQHVHVTVMLENVILAFIVFNIMMHGPKTNMLYSLKAVKLNMQTLIDEQIDSALNRKNATVHCKKTQNFIDILIDCSFIGQKYLANSTKTIKQIPISSQFLMDGGDREHTTAHMSVAETLPVLPCSSGRPFWYSFLSVQYIQYQEIQVHLFQYIIFVSI